MLSEIDTNGEPVTLSASESHVLEVADDSRLTIAVMIRAFCLCLKPRAYRGYGLALLSEAKLYFPPWLKRWVLI